MEGALLWPRQANLDLWSQALSPHLGGCHPGLEAVSRDPQVQWPPGPELPELPRGDLGMKKTSSAAGGHGGAPAGPGGRPPRLMVPLLAPLGFLVPQVHELAQQHEAQAGPRSCPWRWPCDDGFCHGDSVLETGVP